MENKLTAKEPVRQTESTLKLGKITIQLDLYCDYQDLESQISELINETHKIWEMEEDPLKLLLADAKSKLTRDADKPKDKDTIQISEVETNPFLAGRLTLYTSPDYPHITES